MKLSNWILPILKDLKKWLICRNQVSENQVSEKMLTAGIGTEKHGTGLVIKSPLLEVSKNSGSGW